MKLAGESRGEVAFDRLRLPGDFAKRLKKKHVAELAASIERGGLIAPPLVQRRTREVIAGCDRVAAMRLLGWDKIPVAWSDAEGLALRRLRVEENLRRRVDDRDEMLRELVAIEKGEALLAERDRQEAEAKEAIAAQGAIVGQRDKQLPAAAKGRPRSPERAAVKAAAEAAGVSESTVRRALAPEEGQQEGADESTPCIPLLGTDADEAWLAQVAQVQDAVDAADAGLQRAQAALKKLETSPFQRALQQRLYQAAHALAVDVRGSRPCSVCPWCKRTALQTKCTACAGLGYIREEQLAGCPKDLLDESKDVVARDGRFVARAAVTGEKRNTPDAPRAA